MARGEEAIRIPRLRPVVGVLATLVMIGLVVFLRRYRGADRTAMALSLLVGAGLCMVVVLTWFQGRFGGQKMARRDLWGIGLRCGALAGACNAMLGVSLLAARWATDQQAGPAGDPFFPAFLRALAALGMEMASGLPAYLAVGAVLGALTGLATSEAIGISSERVPPMGSAPPGRGDPMDASRTET